MKLICALRSVKPRDELMPRSAYNARNPLCGRGSASQVPADGQAAEEAVVSLRTMIRQSGDVTILDLEGRATIGASSDVLARELRRLRESGARKLLVNLSGVTQIDSSGLSMLVRAFVSLGQSGGSLKLLGVRGRVREVFSVTRLLGAIPTFDDEASALASFR